MVTRVLFSLILGNIFSYLLFLEGFGLSQLRSVILDPGTTYVHLFPAIIEVQTIVYFLVHCGLQGTSNQGLRAPRAHLSHKAIFIQERTYILAIETRQYVRYGLF